MISLCIITKDEEGILEDFLAKIKEFVDEIIIVDTGSKDKTKEIAKRFTDKVYDFKWNDNFADARNFSIEKATKEWILILDPDEKIENNDFTRIKEIISNSDEDFLGYRLIQETYFKNKVASVRGICKVFRNDKRIRFIYPIHETVRESIKKLNGKIGKTGIVIKHYPKINKKKQEYYLKLLNIKKQLFPESNVDKEIKNELNPH